MKQQGGSRSKLDRTVFSLLCVDLQVFVLGRIDII